MYHIIHLMSNQHLVVMSHIVDLEIKWLPIIVSEKYLKEKSPTMYQINLLSHLYLTTNYCSHQNSILSQELSTITIMYSHPFHKATVRTWVLKIKIMETLLPTTFTPHLTQSFTQDQDNKKLKLFTLGVSRP
jgi:hypothetical protein